MDNYLCDHTVFRIVDIDIFGIRIKINVYTGQEQHYVTPITQNHGQSVLKSILNICMLIQQKYFKILIKILRILHFDITLSLVFGV